ncbi:hypothetical protein B0H14DRAFT_1287532 [Mycena olivaceomarginata]|nr:hypothetical protein B0H14DRAFT_1287532 [Mycena olivaceomarginata]
MARKMAHHNADQNAGKICHVRFKARTHILFKRLSGGQSALGQNCQRFTIIPLKTASDTSEPSEPQSPSVLVEEDDDEDDEMPTFSQQQPPTTGGGIDSLTDSLNALALVSPSIRFGRGGKNGGFSNEQQPRGGRSHRDEEGIGMTATKWTWTCPGKTDAGGAAERRPARGNTDPSGGQGQAERSWRGPGRCAEQCPVGPGRPRIRPARPACAWMLYVRGGARGRGV